MISIILITNILFDAKIYIYLINYNIVKINIYEKNKW